MAESWLLDELAHAGSEHLDPDFVARYNRKQGPFPVDDVALLQRYGVGAEATVVDLGAGTGRFTLAMAPHCARVVAVDVSPAMLAAIREQVAAAGLANVECVQAGFLRYEHTGAPADAVYTRHALHQLPDFWKVRALRRIHGVLRDGGLLRVRDLIFDCAPDEVDDVVARWLAGAAKNPLTGYTADDLAEHIREEHSTFRWLLEPMFETCGFEILDVDYFGRAFGEYVCRKA